MWSGYSRILNTATLYIQKYVAAETHFTTTCNSNQIQSRLDLNQHNKEENGDNQLPLSHQVSGHHLHGSDELSWSRVSTKTGKRLLIWSDEQFIPSKQPDRAEPTKATVHVRLSRISVAGMIIHVDLSLRWTTITHSYLRTQNLQSSSKSNSTRAIRCVLYHKTTQKSATSSCSKPSPHSTW